MAGRILFALSLSILLLAQSTSRADYDWYNEAEGSHHEPEGGDDEDDGDGDGYVPPDGGSGSTHAAGEGFSLGVRLAYAHPLGELGKSSDLEDPHLKDFARGGIKGQLDLEYGWSPEFVVALYLGLGGGLLPKSWKRMCEGFDVDCKILLLETGFSMAYRFLPHGLIDPWLGANVGLEWTRLALEGSGADDKLKYLGYAFGAAVGADVQLAGFGFGPYFSPQFGQFTRVKFDSQILGGEQGRKLDKDQRAFHYWLNFGVRARYQF